MAGFFITDNTLRKLCIFTFIAGMINIYFALEALDEEQTKQTPAVKKAIVASLSNGILLAALALTIFIVKLFTKCIHEEDERRFTNKIAYVI